MNYRKKIAKNITLLITLLIMMVSNISFAQLIITPAAVSPQQLVQNVLCGAGVSVSSVKFNGSTTGQSGGTWWNNFGSFTTGTTPTNLGFSSGLILASGAVSGAVGPNNLSSSTVAVAPTTPDSGCVALNALVPGSTLHDAAVLEFDFVPLSDTIKFRYVFGSEEYLEWVNSTFNDIFAFFITGSNPTGVPYNNYNIALVPGTTSPISIDNVNDVMHPQYYIDNTNGSSIQADGFTTVLTAWALVTPCTSYHLKLAIADRGDRAYDSWVWLESNSFTSPLTQVSTNFAHPDISSNAAIRGCNDAIITLRYPSPFLFTQQIDNITVAGTAVYGTDYVSNPNINLIYGIAGSDSIQIVISPLDNATDTTIKTVMLIIPVSACSDVFDTVIINILPKPLFFANAFGDTTVCNINNPIDVIASGGYPPYNYTWSNGDTTATTVVSPLTTTTYHVTVKDACNQTINDSVLITIYCHFANAGPDTTICFGDTATLHASGGIKYSWNTGNLADTTALFKVAPAIVTTYIVTVTNSSNVFTDKDTVTVFVNPLPIITITPDTSYICLGDSVQLTVTGANIYLWTSNNIDPLLPSENTLSNPIVSPTLNTLYRVIGTDINGCINKDSAIVYISPVPIPIIGATPNPVLITDPTVYITDMSNTATNWFWDSGDGNTSNSKSFYHTYSDLDTGRYLVRLVVSNIAGCVDSTSLWVIVAPDTRFYIPNAFSPGKSINNIFRVYGSQILGFEMFIYDRWGELLFYSDSIDKGWDGTYKGQNAPTGIYVYKVLYTDTNNHQKQKAGSVTLIR